MKPFMRPAIFLVATLACLNCLAQKPGSAPAFDAASVHASTTAGNEDPHVQTSPGSLTLRGISLKFCILWAYNMPAFQADGPRGSGTRGSASSPSLLIPLMATTSV
jgi:hypothetical protein